MYALIDNSIPELIVYTLPKVQKQKQTSITYQKKRV